ncbi:MAG: hypothetical protein U1B82_19895 [Cypionkella sp.]|nr:hypothetical protein [Cypionkella sp.]
MQKFIPFRQTIGTFFLIRKGDWRKQGKISYIGQVKPLDCPMTRALAPLPASVNRRTTLAGCRVIHYRVAPMRAAAALNTFASTASKGAPA